MTTACTNHGEKYEILTSDEVFDILDKIQDRIEDAKNAVRKEKAEKIKEVLSNEYGDFKYNYRLHDLDRYNKSLESIRSFMISDDGDTYYIESNRLRDILSWNSDANKIQLSTPAVQFYIHRQVPMPEGFIESYKSVRYNTPTNTFEPIPLTESDRDYLKNNSRFFITIDGTILPDPSEPAIFIIDDGYSCSLNLYYAFSNISKMYQYLYWGRTIVDGVKVREITTKALNNQDIHLVYQPNDISFVNGLNRINEIIRRMNTIGEIKRCTECNKLFITEGKEMEWYDKKGLALPKRCPSCRAKRKVNKA